jgi:hypothetical protein
MIDPHLSHEQATTRLGRNLAQPKNIGIVYDHCFVNADFAGGWHWHTSTSADTDNVVSCTGYVITYANGPICRASCLQTEIALSTAGAEYIAMPSTLREVIPLMPLMKELHTVSVLPVHRSKPNFFCKVHKDNQSTIKMANNDKFTPQTKHIALICNHFCRYVKQWHIETNTV